MNTIFFYWDVRDGKEKEYRDFLFSEYLPSMAQMGVTVRDGWVRMAGAGPQIMAIGEADNITNVTIALGSREFQAIEARLQNYVENYSKHITRKSVRKRNS